MKALALLFLALVVSLTADLGAARQAPCQPSWQSTSGNGMEDIIRAFAVFDDGSGPALYAGGDFSSAGGVSANNIAKWNGVTWSPLGSGTVGLVWALTVFDDGSGAGPALYAGGLFTTAGGMSANRIAKWDGTSWSALGSGLNNPVAALAVFDDGSGAGPGLYAGGHFSSAGGVPAGRVAKWDGASWSNLEGGIPSGAVFALAVFDDGSGEALYAGGGGFTSAGGVPANRIAKWDGSSWASLGSGMSKAVHFLGTFDDGGGGGPALYAGGTFLSAGGVDASGIARWDGSNWSPVGSGVSGGFPSAVNAMTVFDDRSGHGPALYAGGGFLSAGGVPAKNFAKWDGASWSALGSAMNSGVQTLAVFDDENGGGPAIYVGGTFSSSASGGSYFAKWGCPPTPAEVFCTAKTTLFCGAANISATGTSSATATSGFVIDARPVRGCRPGLLLYSNQPTQPGVSFGGPGNGVLCLSGTGLRRAGPIQSNTAVQQCDGTLAIDMNQFNTSNWEASGCNPPVGQSSPAGFLSLVGTTVNAQMWGRDSIPSGQVLSDGISWAIGP